MVLNKNPNQWKKIQKISYGEALKQLALQSGCHDLRFLRTKIGEKMDEFVLAGVLGIAATFKKEHRDEEVIVVGYGIKDKPFSVQIE